MSAYLTTFALAALPALGNFVGGLLAELVHVSQRTLSLALHAAAGIILAVVGLKLMPEALATETPWVVVLAFVAGAARLSCWTRPCTQCSGSTASKRAAGRGQSTSALRWTCSATD